MPDFFLRKNNSMRHLYLPLETYNREFDPKLLLGLNSLMEDAVDCVTIGDQKYLVPALRLGFLKPGIIIIKSAQRYILKTIKTLKKASHKIILQDEEALVKLNDANNDEREETSRNHLLCLNLIDKIFCWHDHELNIYDRMLGDRIKSKCILTGNLRTWMLRQTVLQNVYSDEIKNIKKKYGKFILFNSTFSQTYMKNESDRRSALIKELKLEKASPGRFQSYFEWCEQTQMVVFAFLEFVRLFRKSSLSKNVKLIFRPHPSDDFDFYVHIFQGLEEVVVVQKFSVGPWISAAEVIMGSTCTTLLESAILGKPVIAFIPKIGKSIDSTLRKNIVNQVGFVAESPSVMLETVTSLTKTRFKGEQKALVEKGIRAARKYAGWDIDTPSVQAKIIKAMALKNNVKRKFQMAENSKNLLGLLLKLFSIYYKLFYSLEERQYMNQKFPKRLNIELVSNKIQSLGFSPKNFKIYVNNELAIIERKWRS